MNCSKQYLPSQEINRESHFETNIFTLLPSSFTSSIATKLMSLQLFFYKNRKSWPKSIKEVYI